MKDMKTFWQLTSTATKSYTTWADCHIPSGVWEAYFYELYANKESPTFQVNSITRNLPEWQPVSIAEVTELVNQLKPGKAPGDDGIPLELIKCNIDWWAPILANLFTYIDKNAHMPSDWNTAIIIPIFKKGKKDNPANYCPVSLLSIISKIYARHLYWKLQYWMDIKNVLAEEQAGFRPGRSTLDQALILQHLVEKYSSKAKGSLFAAFIDLKSAFDSISRDRLWHKLEASSVDRRLLLLIYKLHENTALKIRCNLEGQLSNKVFTHNGVKQGCILAPLLFNFYINSMVAALSQLDFHPPKLAGRHLSVLLYADDAVILSQTPIGLQRALRALTQYSQEEGLQINYEKTKIMVFAKRPKLYKWMINEHRIEQIRTFKYLGVVFQSNGNRKAHAEYVAQVAQRSTSVIQKKFYTKGGQYVPAALRLFQAKSISQLLYGAQLGPYSSFTTLEIVQSKFLRAILQVPRWVCNAALRLEVGFLKVESRAWLAIFSFWLKLSSRPSGLASLVFQDNFQSVWKKAISAKLRFYGFSEEYFLHVGFDVASRTLRQRIMDMERQHDLEATSNNMLIDTALIPYKPAKYFYLLLISNQRRAFTLARLNALPSAIQEGKFKKIPYDQRKCPCNSGEIETITHVLLHCPYYLEIRETLIEPYIKAFPGRSEAFYTLLLMSGQNTGMLTKIAKFCAAAIKIRENKVLVNA